MSFYHKFSENDLSLTDWLAVERTVLANERNILAYLRTFLSCAISGAALIKFFPNMFLISYFLFVLGVLIFIFGIKNYINAKNKLNIFKV